MDNLYQLDIKDFFSKCDQIRRKLRTWSHLRKKLLMENFIFCAMCKDNFPSKYSDRHMSGKACFGKHATCTLTLFTQFCTKVHIHFSASHYWEAAIGDAGSSHRRCSIEKCALKNSTKFKRNTCVWLVTLASTYVWVSFLIKLSMNFAPRTSLFILTFINLFLSK